MENNTLEILYIPYLKENDIFLFRNKKSNFDRNAVMDEFITKFRVVDPLKNAYLTYTEGLNATFSADIKTEYSSIETIDLKNSEMIPKLGSVVVGVSTYNFIALKTQGTIKIKSFDVTGIEYTINNTSNRKQVDFQVSYTGRTLPIDLFGDLFTLKDSGLPNPTINVEWTRKTNNISILYPIKFFITNIKYQDAPLTRTYNFNYAVYQTKDGAKHYYRIRDFKIRNNKITSLNLQLDAGTTYFNMSKRFKLNNYLLTQRRHFDRYNQDGSLVLDGGLYQPVDERPSEWLINNVEKINYDNTLLDYFAQHLLSSDGYWAYVIKKVVDRTDNYLLDGNREVYPTRPVNPIGGDIAPFRYEHEVDESYTAGDERDLIPKYDRSVDVYNTKPFICRAKSQILDYEVYGYELTDGFGDRRVIFDTPKKPATLHQIWKFRLDSRESGKVDIDITVFLEPGVRGDFIRAQFNNRNLNTLPLNVNKPFKLLMNLKLNEPTDNMLANIGAKWSDTNKDLNDIKTKPTLYVGMILSPVPLYSYTTGTIPQFDLKETYGKPLIIKPQYDYIRNKLKVDIPNESLNSLINQDREPKLLSDKFLKTEIMDVNNNVVEFNYLDAIYKVSDSDKPIEMSIKSTLYDLHASISWRIQSGKNSDGLANNNSYNVTEIFGGVASSTSAWTNYYDQHRNSWSLGYTQARETVNMTTRQNEQNRVFGNINAILGGAMQTLSGVITMNPLAVGGGIASSIINPIGNEINANQRKEQAELLYTQKIASFNAQKQDLKGVMVDNIPKGEGLTKIAFNKGVLGTAGFSLVMSNPMPNLIEKGLIEFTQLGYPCDNVDKVSEVGDLILRHRYSYWKALGGKQVFSVNNNLGSFPPAIIDELTEKFTQGVTIWTPYNSTELDRLGDYSYENWETNIAELLNYSTTRSITADEPKTESEPEADVGMFTGSRKDTAEKQNLGTAVVYPSGIGTPEVEE